MFLNIFKVRLALAAAGLVVLAGYLVAGGGFGPKSTISIEYGMYPREFAGLQVEIDGKVVGTLEGFGNATRTSFQVKDGRHSVRVLHPDLECLPRTVTSGTGGRNVMLVLDYADRTTPDGSLQTVLTFQ
jgi:hypothetical protein